MANIFDQFDAQPKETNIFDQFDAKPISPTTKQAGFSLGDTLKSLGIGAAGSTKALTDVAGAENLLSAKLGQGVESLQKSLTPERQAELERQAARMKAAEESGSLLQEIKAGALNVAEAPIQSAAQAIGSFAPYLPALFAAPVAAAMRLTVGSQAAIRAVAAQAPKVIGTAQGAGAVKGSIYDGVLQAEMEAGVDPDLAKKKADAAQSYFGGNFDQIALGGGLGFLAGSTGVEKFFTPVGRAGVAPNLGRRVAGAALSESLPEAAQGGQERLAQNIALQREGFDVDTLKGVAGAATQEALTGALGAVPIAALVKPEVKPPDNKVLEGRDAFAKEFGEGTPVDADLTPDAPNAILEPAPEPIQLPGGFTVTQRELSREDVPEAFGIFAEGSDKPLSTVSTQADAETKLASLAEIRQEEQARLLKETDTITKSILGEQRKLDVMEATGQTDTDEYVQAKAMLGQTEEAAAVQIEELNNKIASYSAPLSLAPIGIKTNVQSDFVATRGAEVIGTFPTFEVAEATLRAVEPEVFKQADIEARTQEVKNRTQQIDDLLRPMFTKFNLGDVGLNVVEEIKTQGGALADGSFSRNLIQIAMDAPKPIQIMRHETVHALKELGFFTPQQYKALTERAEKQWIKQYLEGSSSEVNGVQMSRLEAYKELAKDRNLPPEQLQEEIAEEAIADAFGAYDRGETPPPGLIAALYKKLKNFFMNFGQALRGAGFESSEDIFDRIERGELKSSAPKAKQTEKVEQKFSVKQPKKTDEEIEANDVSRLIGSGPYAEAALRIVNSPIEKTSKPLEVDQVGVLYDSVYFEQFKRKGDWRNAEDFRTAVAQAVTELNKQLQQAKSGLDWYEEDIATAFTLTQRFIPSLKKPEKRALFSVIAGIMSPSTNARDNWLIAAQAYQHYEKTGTLPGFNPANNALWMGGLESANKKKQLDMLNAMLQPKSKGGLGEKATVEWLQGEHTVSEITAFRKKYGNMGKSSTGGKMNDILPGYTAFGPKVGPFVMNINGIHEVTVDVWMTRTFNRYFGRMMGPDGKMLRGPTEPERIAIKKLVTDAAQAVNIKPYQVQSVLWFFEQQLFNKLGTGAKSYGFSDGANKFSETQSGAGVSKVPAPDISTDATKDRPAGKQAVRDSKQADTKPARSDQPKDGVTQDETDQPAKLSLRTAFPSAKEAEDAAYKKAAPETREFKLFFGGSQIMEEGRPQVMYHGSASEFTTFLENKPIFVSPEANFAEQFAEDRAKDEGKSTDEVRVYPLFVRAETPFDYKNKEHAAMVTEKIIADQKLSGPDSVVRLKKSTPKASTFKKEIAGGLWSTIEDPIFQDALKSFGFDSFYVKEYGNKNLAVFSASQVKSVTGNIGEFSRESKDMRFSLPTIQTTITDRVNETTFTRERKNFAQRMVDAITPDSASSIRAAFLNRYNQMSVQDKKLAEQMGGPALLADQSSESAALMSDLGAGIAASAMGMGNRNGGIPVLRNGITTIDTSVKGMIASLAPLAAYGDPKVYQYYQYWAMVKRGQRLNKEGKLTGITTTDVAYAKKIEAKFPKDLFNSVQKDLIAFNNGLVKYMVDTGVISPQNGAEFVKYADYIPFYRQMDGQETLGPNLFQSLSGVKPPKKLKGAVAEEAPLADFLETMVRNTQSTIQAGLKNYAGQRAVNVAVQLTAPGMGATRLKTVSQAPNVINVLEKGLVVSYETPDTLLIGAVKSLNLSDLPFMGILSAPADLLRNLVTKDPGFMMANLLRDSLSAYVTSGVKMTPVADTVIGFGKALARTSPGFEALLNAGIIGGYEFSANIDQSGRNLEDDLSKKAGKKDPILLRPFTSLWGALETGTTASDAATRALIYERVLADTGNEAEALYRSLEVMNFHRKGNSALIRVLTAAVPFFNARLQGLDLFYRASTGNMNNRDAAQIQRQFFVRGLTMMALSCYYWYMVSDDEEYKKQEQETKDNNWLIPSLGIRIPIPFEVGVLFKTIPERIAAYVFGNDTGQDLRDALFRSAVGTFAFNPIPQTVKPIVEAAFNINTFTFRPIVSEGMKDVDPQFQVGPGTSSVAKGIAGALGLSPMKVDHILKGYTGTIGMYGIDTIDAVMDQFSDSPRATKRFEQLPIIKRFTVDPEARGNVTEYYKLKDSVDTVVRTMNFLEKQGESAEFVEYLKKNQGTFAFKDYIRDTEKTMKELRQAKSAVQISQMSGDEKRDAITNINRAESAINSEIQRIKKIIASSQ